MKKLGIVGGASWASTALYYEQINRGIAHRLGGLHSAVLSVESLDFAPFAAMQQAEDWSGVAQGAVEAARRLKASGVEGLLLASNTMHRVADEIVDETGLPILHIGDAGPILGLLHRCKGREIKTFDRQHRAMQPTQSMSDAAVDLFII